MSVRITYFVHGTTTDNEANLSSGWNDVELSKLGKQQSKELTAKTSQHNFDVVFTSDLSRAYNSAKLTWGDKYKIIQDAIGCVNAIMAISMASLRCCRAAARKIH